MVIGPAVGLFLMMCAGLAGVVLLAGALIAWRSRRDRLALGFAGGLVGLVALYLATLVAVSTASQRRVLARGEVKHFCGFYLDCHLGVSVDEVRTVKAVGGPEHRLAARGTYLIVALRISSDARSATLSPYGLLAMVVDERGYRYRRARDAERVLLGESAGQRLEQKIEAGGSYTRSLVFDLPADARTPALWVIEEGLPDTLIEAFLIGDEDSLFHKPTLLSLAAPPATGVGR
jgi:hypothetical protein